MRCRKRLREVRVASAALLGVWEASGEARHLSWCPCSRVCKFLGWGRQRRCPGPCRRGPDGRPLLPAWSPVTAQPSRSLPGLRPAAQGLVLALISCHLLEESYMENRSVQRTAPLIDRSVSVRDRRLRVRVWRGAACVGEKRGSAPTGGGPPWSFWAPWEAVLCRCPGRRWAHRGSASSPCHPCKWKALLSRVPYYWGCQRRLLLKETPSSLRFCSSTLKHLRGVVSLLESIVWLN